MKKLLVAVGFLIGCFSGLVNAESKLVDQYDPYVMVKQVAEKTFQRFESEHDAIRKNPNMLKDIVREELMPYVNYKYSAYKVLGAHLKPIKKKSPEQIDEFVPVFLDYLVTEYAQVFTLYNKQKIEFEPSKDTKEKRILAVKTVILQPGGQPIDIAFKVRKNSKSKKWKAFDMVAEGVSLLDSKKAEINTLIRKEGLPYVTKMLKEKSQRDIEFKKL